MLVSLRLSAPPLILGEADSNQQNYNLLSKFKSTPSLFSGRGGVGNPKNMTFLYLSRYSYKIFLLK